MSSKGTALSYPSRKNAQGNMELGKYVFKSQGKMIAMGSMEDPKLPSF